MRKNGNYNKANDKNYIEISANANTLKYEMFLKDNYEVDFRQYNSINSLLDDPISDEEYSLILFEFKTFTRLKEDLREKSKMSLENWQYRN